MVWVFRPEVLVYVSRRRIGSCCSMMLSKFLLKLGQVIPLAFHATINILFEIGWGWWCRVPWISLAFRYFTLLRFFFLASLGTLGVKVNCWDHEAPVFLLSPYIHLGLQLGYIPLCLQKEGFGEIARYNAWRNFDFRCLKASTIIRSFANRIWFLPMALWFAETKTPMLLPIFLRTSFWLNSNMNEYFAYILIMVNVKCSNILKKIETN